MPPQTPREIESNFIYGRGQGDGRDRTGTRALPPPKREWTNSIGMTLVRIEPGSFLMGSTKDQIDQLMRLFPDSDSESGSTTSNLSIPSRSLARSSWEFTRSRRASTRQ